MEDIKEATGINESSLYNTFGCKKELFLEALHVFGSRVDAMFGSLPDEAHPAEAIRGLLRQIAVTATKREGAAGCMLMNSALELGAEHQDIVDFVRERYGRVEELLYQAVVRAQSQGEIPVEKDPKSLARFLTYTLQSMFTIARTNPTEEFMTDVVESTLTVLE